MRLCDFSTFVCSSCFGTGMRCRDSVQDKHVPCSLCSMSLLACPCVATVSVNFPFSETREAREAPEIRDTASFFFFFNFFALCPRAFDALLLLGLSARILKMFIFLLKVNITTRNFAKILCDLNTT